MFSEAETTKVLVNDFKIKSAMMRYSIFVPRLYNFCKSLGFETGKIMPSRAFCSDESQGFPIILIAKHFGTFPFNHGRVGGIVATDRHGPHADHGKHLVIIQASHVGYDPKSKRFGTYCRRQTEDEELSSCCGKVQSVLDWYESEYQFAKQNILLEREGEVYRVRIDNQLLRRDRAEGLILKLDKIISTASLESVKCFSTSKNFVAADEFRTLLGKDVWPKKGMQPIGNNLDAELFYFKRNISEDPEGFNHLENNLINSMPWILNSDAPLLTAAQISTQVEFDRAIRTIVKEKSYQGKKVVFISGLNIDISPQADQLFPLTKFVPWAAHIQEQDGSHYTLEQPELVEILQKQSEKNPDQIDLEIAIQKMRGAQEVKLFI